MTRITKSNQCFACVAISRFLIVDFATHFSHESVSFKSCFCYGLSAISLGRTPRPSYNRFTLRVIRIVTVSIYLFRFEFECKYILPHLIVQEYEAQHFNLNPMYIVNITKEKELQTIFLAMGCLAGKY